MESRKLGPFALPLSLLVLSVLINYIERGNLSIVGPPLKDWLRLSPENWAFCLGHSSGPIPLCYFTAAGSSTVFDVNRVLDASAFYTGRSPRQPQALFTGPTSSRDATPAWHW